MGLSNTAAEGKTALYETTGDWAFGPVFDSEEECDGFLQWLHRKYGIDRPDALPVTELRQIYKQWRDAMEALLDLAESDGEPESWG